MAFELPFQVLLGTLTASSDYNDAADQFCLVKATGAGFKKSTGLGGTAIGVLQDRPSSGTPGAICILGVTKVRCNTTSRSAIAFGDKLCASSGLGGVKGSTGLTRYVVGRALSPLAANLVGLITMSFNPEGAGSTLGVQGG